MLVFHFLFYLLFFVFIVHVKTFFKDWRIIDLQCCISFRCTTEWFRCTLCIFLLPFFRLFSLISYKILNIVPHAMQYVLIISILYIEVCNVDTSTNLSHPAPFLLWWQSVCFLHLWVYFCFLNKIINFSDSMYVILYDIVLSLP